MAGDQERGNYSGAALSAYTERIKLILEQSSPDEAAAICLEQGIPLVRSPPATTWPHNFMQGAAPQCHVCACVLQREAQCQINSVDR